MGRAARRTTRAGLPPHLDAHRAVAQLHAHRVRQLLGGVRSTAQAEADETIGGRLEPGRRVHGARGGGGGVDRGARGTDRRRTRAERLMRNAHATDSRLREHLRERDAEGGRNVAVLVAVDPLRRAARGSFEPSELRRRLGRRLARHDRARCARRAEFLLAAHPPRTLAVCGSARRVLREQRGHSVSRREAPSL